MAVTMRLGGLPSQKIALLQKLADEIEAPKQWQARLLIRGAYHRPTEQTAWTGKASIDRAKGSHAGDDLRAVSLEIGSCNERDVRDARFKFSKLFEKVVSLPCPEPAPRKPHPRSLGWEVSRKTAHWRAPHRMTLCICNSILQLAGCSVVRFDLKEAEGSRDELSG